MKKLLVCCLFLGVAACAPDESGVCDAVNKAYGSSASKPSWSEGDKCVRFFTNWKKRYGVNSYRRLAECYQASGTAFQANACFKKEESRVK